MRNEQVLRTPQKLADLSAAAAMLGGSFDLARGVSGIVARVLTPHKLLRFISAVRDLAKRTRAVVNEIREMEEQVSKASFEGEDKLSPADAATFLLDIEDSEPDADIAGTLTQAREWRSSRGLPRELRNALDVYIAALEETQIAMEAWRVAVRAFAIKYSVWSDDERSAATEDALRRGMADAKEGRVSPMGSFAEYLDDQP